MPDSKLYLLSPNRSKFAYYALYAKRIFVPICSIGRAHINFKLITIDVAGFVIDAISGYFENRSTTNR